LYIGNKLDEKFLGEFLREQRLKIEDIVQIIDYETRDQFFNEAFLKINYPVNFLNKIYAYEQQTRKVKHIEMPLELVDLEEVRSSVVNIDKVLEDFYNKNLNKYMSDEKRDIEYIVVDKKKYISNFTPSDYEISEYYKNNSDLYLEKEKRSFIQFNFKSLEEANNFKNRIENFKKYKDIIEYANYNNIKFNSFNNLTSDEVLEEIASVLFKLQINQQSKIIETTLSKHIIILQNIKPEQQLQLSEVQNDIKETIVNIEVENYLNELNSNIAEKIIEGNSIIEIANQFDLEILKQNNLTKNFSNFDNDQNDFYKSLISNSFAANKDFVNDIVMIDKNTFYIFNVTKIAPSKPVDFSIIKDIVIKDWEKSKRIEKVINESNDNINFLNKLSNLHNLAIEETEIKIDSKKFPKKLITDIFEADIGVVVHFFEEDKVYIVKITNISIPKNINEFKELSLKNDMKVSFGSELIRDKKISINEKLINAVINNY